MEKKIDVDEVRNRRMGRRRGGARMTDQIDLDRLAEFASRATPGPWRCGEDADEFGGEPTPYVAPVSGMADAEYIAALDPTTVLALIERARNAEAERDALAAKIEQVRALASANNRLRDSENACMLYAPSILAILDQNKEDTRE